MPTARIVTFFLITSTLSLKINAQAISTISTKKIEVDLAITPSIISKNEASSDSIRKKPFTYRHNQIPQPLLVADGKVITVERLVEIDPQRIANIEVFKGEQAIAKFGSQGENGVIVIYMKRKKWFNCK